MNKFKYEGGIIVNVSVINKNKTRNQPFVFPAPGMVDGNTTGNKYRS